MEHFDSLDCYFDDCGCDDGEIFINKVYSINGVHRRDTKSYHLRHIDFNSSAGILEFKYIDRDLVNLGDLVEINELKFVVENILDMDNGIMVAVLSDYKESDEYIDFDV